jgi:putative mycofactocin binding protein MftB
VQSDAFDLDAPWSLSGPVALRPEPFGALAYDFATRRLSFLKTQKLVVIVEALGGATSARDACRDAGVTEAELPAYAAALGRLAGSGMIARRDQHGST